MAARWTLGVVVFLIVACGGGAEDPATEADPGALSFANVGSITFPTSAATEAQEHFLRGVTILHSFGYKQAIEEFQKAQELEPDFALAYWGESLCYNHPLLRERDLDSPRQVLARLGATAQERASKAPSEREKGFLAAVEALFGDGEAPERRIAYMEAMRSLHERYPDDPEAAAFYSLSLLGAIGPLGDDTFRLNVEAGAVALDLLAANPDHPGAAHYVIHAFDDPVHAPLALPAARRFAEIAAAVSHARHMPSHIFIQRGMWQNVSASNDSAHAAARDLWEPGDSVADLVHSLDWGHYGDLQRGDYAKAEEWMRRLDVIVEESDAATRAVDTVPLLRARYIVETERWETRPVSEESSSHELLATGISGVKQGHLSLAREAATRLADIASRPVEDRSTFARTGKAAIVMHREVAALVRLAQGDAAGARRILDEGIEVAESMGQPRGSATPVKPVHELYGEVLLELGEAQEAIELFESSLRRTPNRPRSLLGLARAHAAAGQRQAAAKAYARLAAVWEGRDAIEGYQEARRFLDSEGT